MMMALLDSGIHLKSVCSAVTTTFSHDGQLYLDPNCLEQGECKSIHTFAFDSNTGEPIAIDSLGVFSQTQV